MSPFFLLLLVFFPAHACNARILGTFYYQITSKQDFLTKDDHAAESETFGNIDSPKTDESSLSAIVDMNQKHLQTLFSDKQVLVTQGNELTMGYSQKDLPQKTKIKEMKRQERSMVGSEGSDDVEESKEKDITVTDEGIEVMDYAQPHRKPPIHNHKP